MATAFKDMDKVLKKLNNELWKYKGRSMRGLMKGGLIVQRDAQQHVPVEYGVLRQSAYTRQAGEGVEVGFSAAYAWFVHENLEMKWKGRPRKSGKGVYWGPQGEARYLANALDRKRKEIVEAVANDAKRSGAA